MKKIEDRVPGSLTLKFEEKRRYQQRRVRRRDQQHGEKMEKKRGWLLENKSRRKELSAVPDVVLVG